jgi:hypothetical protein
VVVGGLAGVSYPPAIQSTMTWLCVGGPECTGLVFAAVVSAAVAWMVAAVVLLHVLRCRPAWLVGSLGPLLVAVAALVLYLVDVYFTEHTEIVLGVLCGFGYGLAAALTARYGERRDREDASIRG